MEQIDFNRSPRLPVKRSPERVHHFTSSALPLKEFHCYNDDMGLSEPYDRHRTSSMDDSNLLLNQPPHDMLDDYGIDDDASYLYDIDFGNVIQSRTQTTIVPYDIPIVYQQHHRASI